MSTKPTKPFEIPSGSGVYESVPLTFEPGSVYRVKEDVLHGVAFCLCKEVTSSTVVVFTDLHKRVGLNLNFAKKSLLLVSDVGLDLENEMLTSSPDLPGSIRRAKTLIRDCSESNPTLASQAERNYLRFSAEKIAEETFADIF